MEKLGLPKLTTNRLELISEAVETAAKKHIFSKISSKLVETLNIIVETTDEKSLTVEVEVILILSPKVKTVNAASLAKEAVKEAIKTSRTYLRNLK